MEKKYILGIDTSNYMTSVCLVNFQGNVVDEYRKLLPVEKGTKGLQQSRAHFVQTKQLPELINKLDLDKKNIALIAVSAKPRPAKESYMPVFLAGMSIGESIAKVCNIPIFYTTHQEGHIAAGIYSTKWFDSIEKEFIAVHFSGGTTEILLVNRKNKEKYVIEKIGGTLDLNAGQLIDRIGVLFDLTFPSGPYLERLARNSTIDFPRIPTHVKNGYFNLSGGENFIKSIYDKSEKNENDKSLLARSIEHYLGTSLVKALTQVINKYPTKSILFVGGVMQNNYIREILIKKLEKKNINLLFAAANYSGDNAYGVAMLGLEYYFNLK